VTGTHKHLCPVCGADCGTFEDQDCGYQHGQFVNDVCPVSWYCQGCLDNGAAKTHFRLAQTTRRAEWLAYCEEAMRLRADRRRRQRVPTIASRQGLI
jgi:hypothetical protein